LSVSLATCATIRAAPYFKPLDNDPPDVNEVIKATGIKQFVLAFVLAPEKGGCIPTWDGNLTQKVSDDKVVLEKVHAIRAAGGDVSISFGGYNGLELGHAQGCNDVNSLANAYQSVIDKYELTNVDYDIEGDDLGDVNGEHLRFKAIKILKDKAKSKGKQLFVSLTLPTTTVGLSELGKAEIKRAVDDGAVMDLYKIMAFDYGGPGATQAADVKRVMGLVHTQLKQLRPDLKTDDQLYAATGLILMNGHTDQPSELYSLDTFRDLVHYAKQSKYGRVSYWALNRDRPCTGVVGWVNGKCSSLTQKNWEYTKILAEFN